MLSRKEKEELLRDSHSLRRRKNFASIKKTYAQGPRSLDEYIGYLMSLQRIFAPFLIFREATVARFNKL